MRYIDADLLKSRLSKEQLAIEKALFSVIDRTPTFEFPHDPVLFANKGLTVEGTATVKFKVKTDDVENVDAMIDDCIDRDYLELEDVWIERAE